MFAELYNATSTTGFSRNSQEIFAGHDFSRQTDSGPIYLTSGTNLQLQITSFTSGGQNITTSLSVIRLPDNFGIELPAAIDNLSDVDTVTAAPTNGQTLIWNGTDNWVPGDASTVGTINDLTDVDTATSAPNNGDVLSWNTTVSRWEPGSIAPGSIDILTDVDTSGSPGPTIGQALVWNGTDNWIPGTIAGITGIGKINGLFYVPAK